MLKASHNERKIFAYYFMVQFTTYNSRLTTKTMINQTANDRFEKGRGAQFNPKNRFLKGAYMQEHVEGIDDWEHEKRETQYILDDSKTLVNTVTSPDVGMMYSANPYQGCEHGCIYCYARNSHEYWGYSAGIDFESRIVVKKNAPIICCANFLIIKTGCLPLYPYPVIPTATNP